MPPYKEMREASSFDLISLDKFENNCLSKTEILTLTVCRILSCFRMYIFFAPLKEIKPYAYADQNGSQISTTLYTQNSY